MAFTWEMGLLIGVVVAAIVLFSTDWVPPDVVGLCVLLALIFGGLLPLEEAFAGFGSETVIMILGLLLLTAALWRTGVVDWVGSVILKFTGTSTTRMLIVIMLAAATLSAFISNTASTAFFIPVVLGLARKARRHPGELLLPLAFSSILSSSVTLISTSTNIVVSGLMIRSGLEPIGLFEMSPVGIPIVLVGLTYMLVVARKWLPRRSFENQIEEFGIRPYLSEIVILPESPLVGKTLAQAGLGQDLDLTVLRIIRNKTDYRTPFPDTRLQAHDVLVVEGKSEDILKIKDTSGIEIKADVKLSDPNLKSQDLGLVEVILLPRSPLIGRTLKGIRFRERYGLQVLGINRHGTTLREKMSAIPLRMGDTLLVQGPREKLAALEEDNIRIITTLIEKRPLRRRAPLAIGIFVGALALATFKILPLHVSVIAGATLAFLTRCIQPEDAYREVEWKVIILIGCMLGLGVAMERTGTARYLASLIVDYCGQLGPLWLLTGFFVLTVLLTQPMSNQAAAVIIVPIAIQTALQLDLNPRTFAMMVAVAASCSYLTPLEPACLMVYGPGRYRFMDFLKVGAVLTVLVFLVALCLVPRVWPLAG
ncbi:MAG TPA: SLC13 family permease [Verrucomicrobia bacterium]|nr:SLC13 family permease [Verrucomicrobiota bacterium]HOP97395.1 SLC13 family permease [Verrucomicrobiota bacterium]HPU55620.1 SLC13 family permease [Verrucomicrobiota bacterium]